MTKELRMLGELGVRMAGGTDREGGGDGPVVVLLHGFGAPGTDLVDLWRVLDVPRQTRFVFPEAHLELPLIGGRAWWMIDVEQIAAAAQGGFARDLSAVEPEGLDVARAKLLSLLEALERELRVPPSRMVLGGFSQGAMLSLDVALRHPRELAGLVLLSGSLLCRPIWEPLVPRIAGMPVLQSHGRQDPLLSFEMAEKLRAMLGAGGVAVDWIEFNGGHELSMGALDDLGAFISQHLYPREPGDEDDASMGFGG